jgi:hypothetical protein
MDNVKAAAEEAYATIVGELAAPYFFEKLAASGIVPESEKEAAELWEAAHKLHVMYTAEQEKAAAAKVNDLTTVNRQLDAQLAASGIGSEKAASFSDVAALAADKPEIANAVLTLQAAVAAASASN